MELRTEVPAADPSQRQQFIEQMGLVLESYRLTRTAGRTLGYFLLRGVHSLDEAAEQLDVSRGLSARTGRSCAT